jgi:hypothetical protein
MILANYYRIFAMAQWYQLVTALIIQNWEKQQELGSSNHHADKSG